MTFYRDKKPFAELRFLIGAIVSVLFVAFNPRFRQSEIIPNGTLPILVAGLGIAIIIGVMLLDSTIFDTKIQTRVLSKSIQNRNLYLMMIEDFSSPLEITAEMYEKLQISDTIYLEFSPIFRTVKEVTLEV